MLTIEPECPECGHDDIERWRDVVVAERVDLVFFEHEGTRYADERSDPELGDTVDSGDPTWNCMGCGYATEDPDEFQPEEEDEEL